MMKSLIDYTNVYYNQKAKLQRLKELIISDPDLVRMMLDTCLSP